MRTTGYESSLTTGSCFIGRSLQINFSVVPGKKQLINIEVIK